MLMWNIDYMGFLIEKSGRKDVSKGENISFVLNVFLFNYVF